MYKETSVFGLDKVYRENIKENPWPIFKYFAIKRNSEILGKWNSRVFDSARSAKHKLKRLA